jgi:hypothetical protein
VLPAVRYDAAFLPAVRTNFFITSRLRDCLMFMLASGRNAIYIAIFQQKTLTVKNKNRKFQNFLSPFHITSYGPRTPKNGQFFDSKLHIRLIIEALLF